MAGDKVMRKRVNEDFSQAQNDAYDICEYLDKYAPTILYELADYKGSLMNTSKVSFIIHGDWKHDHLYFRDMIEQWANDNGRGIFKIDSKEIGHSYDDSYEAQYDIYITKDQDALDELNSMRRLFVGESLKRRPMRGFKEGAKVKKSCGRRIRESINGECYKEDLKTLIDVFPVYGFHRHDFSLLIPRKQRELIDTIRKRFEVPEGISIRDYVHTEIDDTRPVDDVIRDGIRDDFDYLESICDGDITPELKNLSYLNYGEDIVSEL